MGASWYRDGIQLMDDVKKNGPMLYLNMAFRASKQMKDVPYVVPSIRKTDGVKSSTNSDRTRMPSDRCKSYIISKQTNMQGTNETCLSLQHVPKVILRILCGRHGHIWGGEFPVVKYVYPVNGTRLILRTLYEHLTTLYLIWSPVPEQVLRVPRPLRSG